MDSIIRIPFLSGDLTYTVSIYEPTDLTTAVESGIALSVVDGQHQGTVTGSLSGRYVFVIFHGGQYVTHRVAPIKDTAGPFTILDGLDSTGVALAGNPDDSEQFCTGWSIVYDELGEREDNVDVSIQMLTGPGTAGFILDTAPRTSTSATVTIEGETVAGYVEFPKMRCGATYAVVRGTFDGSPATVFSQRSTGTQIKTTVPFADRYAIDEVLGRETAA